MATTRGKMYLGNTLLCGGSTQTTGDWVRPLDWLPMPTSIPQSIDILTAVFENGENQCGVSISTSVGTYTVDWGDGTIDTGIASNTIIGHIYNYSNLLGTESTRGYRQALIRITPDSGLITKINLTASHPSYQMVGPKTMWLDVAINASSLQLLNSFVVTDMLIYDNVFLERINIIAIGNIVGINQLFRDCYSLQSVTFPEGSLVNLSSMRSAFRDCCSLRSITFPAGSLVSLADMSAAFELCESLQSVTFPEGSLVQLTNMASTFYGCTSLRSITFPVGSLVWLTDIRDAFNQCTSLQSVTFPEGSLANVTSMTGTSGPTSRPPGTFSQCTSLRSITFPEGSLVSLADMSSAFQLCTSLQSVTFPAGSLVQLTKMSSAFYGCTSLRSITFPEGSLANVTTISLTFGDCSYLQSITFPEGSFANLAVYTNTNYVFIGCYNLSNIDNCSIRLSFSVANCNFDAAGLNKIYSALPNVSEQVITVSNNPGTTSDNPSIAIVKGWTVVG